MKLPPEKNKAKSFIEAHHRNLEAVLELMRERLSAQGRLKRVEDASSSVELHRHVRATERMSFQLSRIWDVLNAEVVQ